MGMKGEKNLDKNGNERGKEFRWKWQWKGKEYR